MPLPSSLSSKSWTRTLSGSPWGCHSRPPFLKSPINSFFFASTEITGCPRSWNSRQHRLRLLKLLVAIGVLACSFLTLLQSLQTVFQVVIQNSADGLLAHRPSLLL